MADQDNGLGTKPIGADITEPPDDIPQDDNGDPVPEKAQRLVGMGKRQRFDYQWLFHLE